MPTKWIFLFLFPILGARAECVAPEVFSQANSLLQSRKYEETAKALDRLRPCKNLFPIERFEMAWLYGRARQFSAALDLFNSVPESVPDPATHKYAVALTKFELGDYRGTSEILKSLRSKSTLDSKGANLLAVSYAKLGLFQDAFLVLSEDVHDHPQDLSGYLNLVTVCAEGGDLEKAASVASDASRLFPDSSEAFVDLGAAATLLGHLDAAKDDFLKAASLSPRAAEPRFFVALTQYKLGEYSIAIALLKSAIDEGLLDPDLHYLMAECFLKLDPASTPEAIAQLNRAIKLNGNSVSARTLRGRLLLEAGHLKEAVTDLQFAHRLDESSRSAAYNLARAYRAEGRTEEAEVLFKRLRSEAVNTLTEFGDKRLNQALQQDSNSERQ
jgi:tetratricopeptide (TPR) repeat protein